MLSETELQHDVIRHTGPLDNLINAEIISTLSTDLTQNKGKESENLPKIEEGDTRTGTRKHLTLLKT